MLPTSSVPPMPIPRVPRGLLASATLVAIAVSLPSVATAAVPWHADLKAACRASTASQRPVLAIFVASWSSSSTTLDRTTFASDEAVALITACFEPVCVDVDAHADTTRRLGVSKVPTACILAADEQVLAQFELPETPAGFVAAAARGLREATVASSGRAPGPSAAQATGLRGFGDVSADASGALPPFGGSSPRPAAHRDLHGGVPPGGQAITAVAAKVRRLSDFASEEPSLATKDTAIAASFRHQEVGLLHPPAAPRIAAPSIAVTEAAPAVAAAPPHTIETAASPASQESALPGTVAGGPLSIEPAAIASSPTMSPARSAPWLGMPEQEASTAAAGPPAPAATTTTASAAPTPTAAAASLATAAPVQPPATSAQAPAEQPAAPAASTAAAESRQPQEKKTSPLIAALQKPLSLFAPSSGSAQKAAAPGDGGATAPATAATTQTAATAPPPDDQYGSMPVGMEGYCPVTLAERGQWIEGRAQWGVRHRGRTYLFAGAEQQKAFLADPDRYAPALSGDDPVLALDAGKSTPGQRRYGVTYQSRTYLFSSSETRDAFAANPQRYTGRAMVAENLNQSEKTLVR